MGSTYTVSNTGNITTDGFINIGDGSSATYRVNNVQISSADLSDVASLGMLDEDETITGNWSFTHAGGIEVTNDVNAGTFTGDGSAITAIAEGNITDGAILARIASNESITGDWLFSHANGLSVTNHFDAGTLSIGVATPNSFALVEMDSTTKGFLPPRMTTAQKTTLGTNLAAGDEGMLIWDTDLDAFFSWDGSAFTELAGGGGTATVIQEEYVVGSALDNYSGSTTVFDLVETYTLASGELNVYVNGVLQLPGGGNDYVETDTDTITFNTAQTAADNVQIQIIQSAGSIQTPTGAIERREEFTAAGGSEQFTLSTGEYTQGGVNLNVFVNGAIQLLTTNYTEDSTTTFTISSGLTASDTVTASWTETAGSTIAATAATEVRQNFTAAGGAETFTLTGGAAFSPGGDNLKVYLDGVLLQLVDDYTEGGTTQAIFSAAQAPTAGQKVAMVAITETGPLGTPVEKRNDDVATASQTLFTLPFGYRVGAESLQVFNDGILMTVGASADYVETSPTSFTFNSGRTLDSTITAIARGTVQNLETGLPRWQKVTVAGSAFSGGTTGPESVALTTMAAGGIIHGVKMKASTAWTGGSLTAYTLEVGISGDTAKYASAFDVWQTVADDTFQLSDTFATEDHGSTTAITLTANSTTDNTGNVDSGASVDVWLLISEAV